MRIPHRGRLARARRARRAVRLRARLAVRHAAAEPRCLDDARAGGRADRAHRVGSGRPGALPAPPDGQRRGHGHAGRAGSRPGRGGVRDRLHRPPGHGLPRHPLGLHGRLHPRLPRPAARRDDRVGGGAHADAAPARPRRSAADRRAGRHRRAGAQGRRRRARAGRRAVRDARAPEFAKEFSWVSYLFWGTVRDDGEELGSDRVRAAGGPGWALAYHGAYEFGPRSRTCPVGRVEGGGRADQAGRTPPHRAQQHGVGLNGRTRRPGTRAAIGCWKT